MKFPRTYCAVLVAVAPVSPFVAAVEPAQQAINKKARSEDPIVKVVKETINSVVAIRVARPGAKDMIGSGVIVRASGLIVTNRHVVGSKKFVKVRLHDRTDLDGEVVHTDAHHDLAIVRIKTDKKLVALSSPRPTT